MKTISQDEINAMAWRARDTFRGTIDPALSKSARVSLEGAAPKTVQLDCSETARLKVRIPAHKRTWLLFTTPGR